MSASSAPTCCPWRKTATLVAVFAMGGLTGWTAHPQKSATPEPETVEVWVATRDLPVGTILDRGYLLEVATKKRLSGKYFSKGFVVSDEELYGKRLTQVIREGEPFNSTNLSKGMVEIPSGMEIVSIQFSKSNIEFAIGNTVDIIAILERGNKLEAFPIVRGVLGVEIDVGPLISKSGPPPTKATFAMSKDQMRLIELAKARGCDFEFIIPAPRMSVPEAEVKAHFERAQQFLAHAPE